MYYTVFLFIMYFICILYWYTLTQRRLRRHEPVGLLPAPGEYKKNIEMGGSSGGIVL